MRVTGDTAYSKMVVSVVTGKVESSRLVRSRANGSAASDSDHKK